jgi:hypothetical protein
MESTNNEQPMKKSHKGLKIGIAAVGLIAVAAITVFAGKSSTDQTVGPSDPSDTSAQTQTTADNTVATKPSTTILYKNGTYSATGSYMSPGGLDQLGVSLTLKDDVITDATVTDGANDGTSRRYQSIFIANYKQYVIGKKIENVKLGRVSGSSLTGQGFNAALLKIEAQAKA